MALEAAIPRKKTMPLAPETFRSCLRQLIFLWQSVLAPMVNKLRIDKILANRPILSCGAALLQTGDI